MLKSMSKPAFPKVDDGFFYPTFSGAAIKGCTRPALGIQLQSEMLKGPYLAFIVAHMLEACRLLLGPRVRTLTRLQCFFRYF